MFVLFVCRQPKVSLMEVKSRAVKFLLGIYVLASTQCLQDVNSHGLMGSFCLEWGGEVSVSQHGRVIGGQGQRCTHYT